MSINSQKNKKGDRCWRNTAKVKRDIRSTVSEKADVICVFMYGGSFSFMKIREPNLSKMTTTL